MSSFHKQLGNRPEVTVENVNRVYPTMNLPYVTLAIYFGHFYSVDSHRVLHTQSLRSGLKRYTV
jgi:hypothetical protein